MIHPRLRVVPVILSEPEQLDAVLVALDHELLEPPHYELLFLNILIIMSIITLMSSLSCRGSVKASSFSVFSRS